MSLINDALKKAEQNSGSSPSGNEPGNPQQPPHNEPPPSQILAQAIAFIGVMALIVSVGIWWVLGAFDKDDGENSGGNAQEVAKQEKAAPILFKATKEDSKGTPKTENELPPPAIAIVEKPKSAEARLVQMAQKSTAKIIEEDNEVNEILASQGDSGAATQENSATEAGNTSALVDSNIPPDASTQTPPSVTKVKPEQTASNSIQDDKPAPVIKPKADRRIELFLSRVEVRGVGRGKVLLQLPGEPEATAFRPGEIVDGKNVIFLNSIEQDRITFKDKSGYIYFIAR